MLLKGKPSYLGRHPFSPPPLCSSVANRTADQIHLSRLELGTSCSVARMTHCHEVELKAL
jgi:hypothetical protein